jgi:hypothetical protein
MILADNETRVDLLNNEAIAKTIIGLLRERPDRPVTIGVHGDWGAGKSSVLEMIEGGLASTDAVLCLKFNGWRFQGFEDAKIALIEGIVTGLIERRPLVRKATQTIKDVFNAIDWLKVAKKAGGLAMTAFTGIPTPEQIGALLGKLGDMAANPKAIATRENLTNVIDGIQGMMKPVEAKNVPQEVEAFREAFDQLLKDAGVEQLVVLIDDLDRCLPDTAIETLEAIRLLVFTARTAFVVAADEAMIEYAVRKHFPDLPDSTGPRDYARNYLEKLIQIPFRIPALGETETRIYVTLLLAGDALGEGDASYAKLIAAARARLKRPWDSAPLDATAVKEALGDDAGKVHNALMLSQQIGPILAGGTKGNPRQIKRFLNTLLLRERTATARGFGDEIRLPVLAKLMLAERFIPRLFEQIAYAAAAHPKGLCEDIAVLETIVDESRSIEPKATAGGERKTAKVGDATVVVTESGALTAWKASEVIRDWAMVQPKLANVDMRPYLFVTKDKKDYFGPMSVLGHLATIVEKLFDGKFAVQGYEDELKRLLQPEAERVFEAVRTRIMGDGDFESRPAGIDGLVVLVRAHPTLQDALIDFLEGLPVNKCGTWAVSGWQGAVKDSAPRLRLQKLLTEWSKNSGNPFLKPAAEAALKDLKGVA